MKKYILLVFACALLLSSCSPQRDVQAQVTGIQIEESDELPIQVPDTDERILSVPETDNRNADATEFASVEEPSPDGIETSSATINEKVSIPEATGDDDTVPEKENPATDTEGALVNEGPTVPDGEDAPAIVKRGEVLAKALLYDGIDGESVWYYLEEDPDSPMSICFSELTFTRERVSYYIGYYASDFWFEDDGTYQITEEGNLHLDFSDMDGVYIHDYAVEVSGDTIVFTQISEHGLSMIEHAVGDASVWMRGRATFEVMQAYFDRLLDDMSLTEAKEERFIRIAQNVCSALFDTTASDGLQIGQPIVKSDKCHITTYLPGYSGPTRFVEFIFDLRSNSETGIVDNWGERTEFQLAGYDYPVKSEPPRDKSFSGTYQTVMGYEFYIPEGFVIQQASRAPTGEGYEYCFYHAELEMTIYFYELYTEFFVETGREMMESSYARYAEDDSVIYFPKGDDWFVASGYAEEGNIVYYTKVHGDEDMFYYYAITYPTANKELCDQMVGDFAESFR